LLAGHVVLQVAVDALVTAIDLGGEARDHDVDLERG
jgi:hypothetical protein